MIVFSPTLLLIYEYNRMSIPNNFDIALLSTTFSKLFEHSRNSINCLKNICEACAVPVCAVPVCAVLIEQFRVAQFA